MDALKSYRKFFSAFMSCLLLFLTFLLPSKAFSETGRTVRIGWYDCLHFQEGYGDGTEKSGFSFEYLQKISDYTGWDYEYVYGEWADLLEALEEGRIDLLAGVSETKERSELMLFPDIAMGTDRYYLYQHSDSRVLNASIPETFNGKKIGTIRNNLMTTCLIKWAEENGINIDVVYYDGFSSRDADFEAYRLDGITATDNNILPDSGYHPVAKVGEEPFYLAVAKSRKDLLKELNNALNIIDMVDPYFLTNLSYRSYGTTLSSITLSPEEEEWLADHDTLRVGFINSYMPFCGIDGDGHITGLITDLIPHIVSAMKIDEKLSITYIGYDSFKDMAESLKNGETDITFPVIGERSYLNDMNIHATSDIITVPFALAYVDTYSDDTFSIIALNSRPIKKIKEEYPDSTIMTMSSAEDCLDAVLDGTANCTIMASFRLNELLNNSRYRNIKTMPFSATMVYSIGVGKDNSALLSLMNKGAALIDKTGLTDLLYKHIQAGSYYTPMDFLRENSGLIFLIIFGLFAAITGALTFFLKTVSKAREKADALNRQLEEYSRLQAQKNIQLSEALDKVNIFAALSHDYEAVHIADLEAETLSTICMDGEKNNEKYVGHTLPYTETTAEIVNRFVKQEERDTFLDFLNIENLKDLMNNGNSFFFRYEGIPDARGRTNYEMQFVPVYAGNGKKLLAIGTKCIDSLLLTEQKRKKELEEALTAAQKANSAKSEFLSRMSHDIRTPLNGIIGLLEINEAHKHDKELIDANRKKAKIAANHLLTLINDVLDMSKLEDGRTEIPCEPFNLLDVCTEVIAICAIKAKDNGITLFNDGGKNLIHPDVYGSPLHVKQIFFNLVTNGIKYNKPNGSISCTSEMPAYDGETVTYRFIIQDTGIGISSEFMKDLYNPFTQEHNDARSRYQGTGMGMAIVKSLLDKMNGTIECESKIGVGTTFTVTIPFKINHSASKSKENEQETVKESIDGMRILLAEDNELNREIAQTILQDMGASVTITINGQEAYESYMNKPAGSFDMILMDIMMPVLDGYEATKKIRTAEKSDAGVIPIIAMTANAFADDVQRAKCAGMNDHISKPLDIKNLLKTLSKYR